MAINRIRADIDLDAILYNMESMHNKLKPGTMMAAVVKADGYGHGAEAVSEVLEPLPYLWGYAVAKQRGNGAYCGRQEKADTYFRTQLPGAV